MTPGVSRKAAVRLQPGDRLTVWELTAALAQGVATGGMVGWLRSSWLTLVYSGDCLQLKSLASRGCGRLVLLRLLAPAMLHMVGSKAHCTALRPVTGLAVWSKLVVQQM